MYSRIFYPSSPGSGSCSGSCSSCTDQEGRCSRDGHSRNHPSRTSTCCIDQRRQECISEDTESNPPSLSPFGEGIITYTVEPQSSGEKYPLWWWFLSSLGYFWWWCSHPHRIAGWPTLSTRTWAVCWEDTITINRHSREGRRERGAGWGEKGIEGVEVVVSW